MHSRLFHAGARLLAAGALLLLLTQASALAQAPASYFYYFQGNKITLPLDPTAVVVRFRADLAPDRQGALLQNVPDVAGPGRQDMGTGRLNLVPVRRGAAIQGVLARLNQDAGVELAAPVFQFPDGGRYLLTDEFIVKFKADVTPAQQAALHRARGAEVARTIVGDDRTLIVRVVNPKAASALDLANAYVESGLVEYAEPDFLMRLPAPPPVAAAPAASPSSPPSQPDGPQAPALTPNDGDFGLQWGLNNTGQFAGSQAGADMDAAAAWNITTGASSIVIAVIDDGVQSTHPDLSGKVIPGRNFTTVGSNSDTEPINPSLDNHGTAVAGVIAAVTNNSTGVAGTCWQCKIMPIKVAYDSGGGWSAQLSWLVDGINWAWQNGADVLNNSWFLLAPSPAVNSAIQGAYLFGRCNSLPCSSVNGGYGSTVIFSAGNNDRSPVEPPSDYKPYVISVGASNWCDGRKTTAGGPCNNNNTLWGSNYGADLNLLAPGLAIRTTDTTVRGSYSYLDGTSFSAPFVSGVVGLMYSLNSTLYSSQLTDPNFSPLRLGADYQALPPTEQGWGRLNAWKSLRALYDLALTTSDNQRTAFVGQTITYTQAFTNTGMTQVNSAKVTVTLPPNVQYVSSSPVFTDNGNGTLTRTVGPLPVGGSGATSVTVCVLSGAPGSVQSFTARIGNIAPLNGVDELNATDNAWTDTDTLLARILFPLLRNDSN